MHRLSTIQIFPAVLLFAVLSSSCHRKQNTNIDPIIDKELADLHLPGLAACKISNGKILWTGYYGYQNIEKNIPVTKNTLFMIASVSKTITASALMQLYSDKKLKLDDDINLYLDFKVVNPNYPDAPITFRELLRHRSSIKDNYQYLDQFWSVNKGDPTIPLGVFLKDYLSTRGAHFDKDRNFYKNMPDKEVHYSNIGFALIGYLVERISGEPFDKFCQKRIFEPLSMNETGWFLRDLDTNNIAMPYIFSDSLKKYIPCGQGGFPDYPEGELRTSAEQYANFLIAWTNNGKWDNKQVFDSTSIQVLTPDEYNLGFHTWFLFVTNNGEIVYSHAGADLGASSFVLFNPKTKTGVILFANGEIGNRKNWQKIISLVYGK